MQPPALLISRSDRLMILWCKLVEFDSVSICFTLGFPEPCVVCMWCYIMKKTVVDASSFLSFITADIVAEKYDTFLRLGTANIFY